VNSTCESNTHAGQSKRWYNVAESVHTHAKCTYTRQLTVCPPTEPSLFIFTSLSLTAVYVSNRRLLCDFFLFSFDQTALGNAAELLPLGNSIHAVSPEASSPATLFFLPSNKKIFFASETGGRNCSLAGHFPPVLTKHSPTGPAPAIISIWSLTLPRRSKWKKVVRKASKSVQRAEPRGWTQTTWDKHVLNWQR
jgi:hypothetical protein